MSKGERKGNSVTVRKWKGHQTYSYRATWIEGGKDRTKGFRAKTVALDFKDDKEAELKEFGSLADISSEERAAVVETRPRLLRAGLRLRDAIESALGIAERDSVSVPVSDLVKLVIDERERANLSDRYIQDLKSRLGRFEKDFGKRIVSSVTREDLTTWLDDLKQAPRTRNNYLGALRLLFNEGAKRRFCDESPALHIIDSKLVQKEAGILTPAALSKLIEVSPEDLLPVVLLGAFAGMRRAEIKRLEWSAIDYAQKHIYIGPKISKGSGIRYIPIEDNLLEWLRPYKDFNGKIWPTNGDDKLTAARDELREADMDVPDNALRHSYGSHHLAKYGNIHETAQNMDNSPTMIVKHYRKAVPKQVAEDYFNISPESKDNIISISA